VELVEQKIKAAIDLSKANHGCGAILYDGWDGGCEHYVGLFLLFTQQVLVGEPHIVLLVCSPMNHTEDDNGKVTDALTFNTEQHIEFFQELLLFYGLTFSDRFITNQIADNTSVNKKIARILDIPHVGCTNHKFNLEVEDYMKQDFADILDGIRETMVLISSSHKFKAMLCQHTSKQPLFYNNTRWYGKYTVVKQWLEIYLHVLEVNRKIADKDRLDRARRASETTHMDLDPSFKMQAERLLWYLDSFHKTHEDMQKKGITLESCQEHLDGWVAQSESPQDMLGDKLYGCRLGTNWIKRNACIVANIHFENAVVKLQQEQHDTLTLDEMEAAAAGGPGLRPKQQFWG
jgi:hypothetical protein